MDQLTKSANLFFLATLLAFTFSEQTALKALQQYAKDRMNHKITSSKALQRNDMIIPH